MYVNKVTGEVMVFKTQFTENPSGALVDFGPSRTKTDEFEDLRHMVNRVKNGEVRLLGSIKDDIVLDGRIDSDNIPLDVATPDEFYEDPTDLDYVKEYAKVLAAETSERSADNHEAQKASKTAQESGNGQASDNGASANVDAVLES